MKNFSALLWVGVLAIGLGIGTAALYADGGSLAADLAELGGSDAHARHLVISKLEKRSSSTASALVDELGESHSAVAKGAMVRIIKKIGLSTADAAALKAHLASPDTVTRHAAATALQAKPSLAISDLQRVAFDKSETTSIRCAAVAALGNATQSMVGPLADIADDEDEPDSLRWCALQATCRNSIAGTVATRLRVFDTKRTDRERLEAVRALGAEGSLGGKELAAVAKGPWPFLAAEALSVMPNTGDATLLMTATSMFGSANIQIRRAALQATIGLGGEATHKAKIKGMIADADPVIQTYAIRSVARTYDATATAVITALKGQLANASFRVRYEAALALNTLGDKSGAATMAADKALANQSHAKTATAAWKTITGK